MRLRFDTSAANSWLVVLTLAELTQQDYGAEVLARDAAGVVHARDGAGDAAVF